MRRLFTMCLIARVVLWPTRASELILTGISASGGTVRAFFSAPGGGSTFSLHLHEEAAGIRFERLHRRTQQVWIVESGEGRWLGLGRPGGESTASLAPQHGAGSSVVLRPEGTNPSNAVATGGVPASLVSTGGAGGSANAESMESTASGAADVDTPSRASHRWKPGVVREPTVTELHRARYGAAALEAAVRNGQIPRE